MELSRAQTDDPHRCRTSATVEACEAAGDGEFEVRLSETVFYPEGGGQPADRGRIGEAEVRDVQRDEEGRIVHRVDSGLEVGEEAELEIDWRRRFDLMQQHTAQHLLTALADDEFDAPTVSFHLGDEYASIDLDVSSFSEPDLEELQAHANREIRRARPVEFRFVDRETYASMDVRSRGLPDEHAGEVRVVEIEGIDANTCGGTHVANLAELQAVALTGIESTRERIRLSYLAGGRVLRRLDGCLQREEALNGILSCGYDEHVSAVERTVEEAKETTNRVTRYQRELAEHLVADLAGREGPVVELHRRETDFQFLNDIARGVLEAAPERIVLLTGAEPLHADEGVFLIAGPEEWIDTHAEEVAEIVDGRGGGPPGIYQGRASRLDRRDAALEYIESAG